MGGGIATIVAPNLEIAKTHKTEFSITTVIKRQNKFFIVINFYCPPTTS